MKQEKVSRGDRREGEEMSTVTEAREKRCRCNRGSSGGSNNRGGNRGRAPTMGSVRLWSKFWVMWVLQGWVAGFGVSPRGWCWEIFKRISELWGRLISLGKPIPCTGCFGLWVLEKVVSHLSIEDSRYRVVVKKVGSIISSPSVSVQSASVSSG